MSRARGGVGLIEVLVAAAILGLLGVSAFEGISGGVRVGELAGRRQLAASVGRRVMDRLLLLGFEQLLPEGGEAEAPVSLGALVHDQAAGVERVEIDGVRLGAISSLRLLRPGLLRLEVRITASEPGALESSTELVLVRLLSDSARTFPRG